jgi:asparagine synthase (glutamine-hydrolysing)
MTAFAALLYPAGAPQSPHDLSRVGAAVGAVTGHPAASMLAGRCALMLAPLHRDDPRAPVVHAGGAVAIVGQALFEDCRALNRALGLRDDAHALSTAAAAYLKWRDRFAEHLTGEFAFALWDEAADRLVCARDGLGVRVLYVAEGPEMLIATNVVGAALAHPAIPSDLDPASLVSFLSVGDSGDPLATAYRAVRAVPEGHTVAIGDRAPASLRRHWAMPEPQTIDTRPADIVDGYRAVLAAAVADRLGHRTAIFLSGGIDSTSIAAAATRRGDMRALTIEYRRFARCDEPRYAREAAAALGLPLSVVAGDDHDPLTAPAPALPVDEPSLKDWRHAMKAGSAYASVGLWGEDGDSLFQPAAARELLRAENPRRIARAAISYALSTRRRPYVGLRLRERLGLSNTVPISAEWITPPGARLLRDRSAPPLARLRPEPLPIHRTRSAAHCRLTTNIARSFAITIAAETTGAPIELRFPLLDSRVIRYVFSVPSIPWCQDKTLPRIAYSDVLPRSILARRKTPVVGFNEWLVAKWRAAAPPRPELLAVPREWIDIDRWRAALARGSAAETMAAWRVLLLDRWLASASGGEELCIS